MPAQNPPYSSLTARIRRVDSLPRSCARAHGRGSIVSDCKRVYRFGTDAQGTCVTEGDKSMNFVLGGKGANLAEMSRIGLPVPGGFTITCQTCVEYSGAGNVWPEGALDEIVAAEADLEARCGKKLGDANDPLLVSVRSGAPFSMPGMMDTVLNLGLNDDSVQGLIAQTQNPRFAWDSYRRFIQMFSNVVMGIDGDLKTKCYFNPFIADFGEEVTFDGYSFATANDAIGRDPMSWTVEAGVADGSAVSWLSIGAVEGFEAPKARHAEAGKVFPVKLRDVDTLMKILNSSRSEALKTQVSTAIATIEGNKCVCLLQRM